MNLIFMQRCVCFPSLPPSKNIKCIANKACKMNALFADSIVSLRRNSCEPQKRVRLAPGKAQTIRRGLTYIHYRAWRVGAVASSERASIFIFFFLFMMLEFILFPVFTLTLSLCLAQTLLSFACAISSKSDDSSIMLRH